MKLKRRLAALESAGRDTYVPVDLSRFQDLFARLDATRHGRPFSTLRAPAVAPAASTKPEDPLSPGAGLVQRLDALRKTLANDRADVAFEQQRRETIRAIEREQRDAERRQRQKAKRARRKERQRLAAAGESLP